MKNRIYYMITYAGVLTHNASPVSGVRQLFCSWQRIFFVNNFVNIIFGLIEKGIISS